MRILLTNDDGFDAKGIKVLDEVLTKAGHDVWICAPSQHKSSTSHSLSNTAEKMPVEIEKQRYSFDGQPADCMMTFLGRKTIPCEPDIVISGINNGFNLSIDILYSGTCGAASEAVLWGYKAIAISSQGSPDVKTYYKAASFLSEHLDALFRSTTSGVFLNINVPSSSDGNKFAIARRFTLVHRDVSNGDKSLLIEGKKNMENGICDSDLAICARGLISITPISVSPAIPEKNLDLLQAIMVPGSNYRG